ncbi:GxxExxY protein [Patescibacteria group bacterium]|nr:GxxExxY protein [Patescibacteria group bacterium]
MEGKFLEKELSYKLVGCFYKVRNLYGVGHREKFYDDVLAEVLESENLSFVEKPRVPLYSILSGKQIGYNIPDKLVEDKIIVEIKAKSFFTKDDINQATEYLKITECEILYLVNFSESEFRPRRFIFTNDRKPFLNVK